MPDTTSRIIRLSWEDWQASRAIKKAALAAIRIVGSFSQDNRQERGSSRARAHFTEEKRLN